MTDAATQPQPEQPKPDPNEMLQPPPMKRSDIGNIITCISAFGSREGINSWGTLLDLAARLSQAKPVPKDGNRHQRRAKGAKA